MNKIPERRYIVAGLVRLLKNKTPLDAYVEKYAVTPGEVRLAARAVIQSLMQNGPKEEEAESAETAIQKLAETHGFSKDELVVAAWEVVRGVLKDPDSSPDDEKDIILNVIKNFLFGQQEGQGQFGVMGLYSFVTQDAEEAGTEVDIEDDKGFLWGLADPDGIEQEVIDRFPDQELQELRRDLSRLS